MRLIIIRHGETFSNEAYGTNDQVIIGQLDCEYTLLNEKGIHQAKQAKDFLNKHSIVPDVIFVSDITRAKQTASIIFEDASFIEDSRLRERSLGHFEGVRYVDIKDDINAKPYLVDTKNDSFNECITKKPEDGENYVDVYNRCTQLLNDIDTSNNQTIAFVSHFHTIRNMLFVLNKKPLDERVFQLMIENSTPYIFDYHDGKYWYEGEDELIKNIVNGE